MPCHSLILCLKQILKLGTSIFSGTVYGSFRSENAQPLIGHFCSLLPPFSSHCGGLSCWPIGMYGKRERQTSFESTRK